MSQANLAVFGFEPRLDGAFCWLGDAWNLLDDGHEPLLGFWKMVNGIKDGPNAILHGFIGALFTFGHVVSDGWSAGLLGHPTQPTDRPVFKSDCLLVGPEGFDASGDALSDNGTLCLTVGMVARLVVHCNVKCAEATFDDLLAQRDEVANGGCEEGGNVLLNLDVPVHIPPDGWGGGGGGGVAKGGRSLRGGAPLVGRGCPMTGTLPATVKQLSHGLEPLMALQENPCSSIREDRKKRRQPLVSK